MDMSMLRYRKTRALFCKKTKVQSIKFFETEGVFSAIYGRDLHESYSIVNIPDKPDIYVNFDFRETAR
jgi:hypothetical protein